MPATTTTATIAMVIRCVSERLAKSFFIVRSSGYGAATT
jgi:hypothetical protein